MLKSGFDPEALAEMFASASAKQTAQIRDAVTRATLAASLAAVARDVGGGLAHLVDRVGHRDRQADA